MDLGVATRCSKKILSDNGCEFNKGETRQFDESFNVKIMTTVAEIPCSNETCERLNAIFGDMATKLVDDTACDVSIGLASWVLLSERPSRPRFWVGSEMAR